MLTDEMPRAATRWSGMAPCRGARYTPAIGAVRVKVPRVQDRSGTGLRFHSALLPPSLDYVSVRWQALMKIWHKMTPMLYRRHLEVCVFHHLDRGLRSGDMYVEGSETYADYRQQLLV
jgi:hypothetical protein